MYQIGIDIGGTFTDGVMLDERGNVWRAKVSTTPGDLSKCFFGAVDAVLAEGGLEPGEVGDDLTRIMHGTTVATNIAVQMNGAKVGLLTTAGFRDTIHMMQGHGYTAGIPDEQVTNVQEMTKPAPLVPKAMIREVYERVDSKGDVVVALNEEQARKAAAELIEAGAEAIAICFLWSFLNVSHEQRMREIVAEIAPDAFITVSSDIAPKSGEYARTVATGLNAFTGPATARYIEALQAEIGRRGWSANLNIVQCGGGVFSPDESIAAPVKLIGSGPVGGTVASKTLGEEIGEANVLATDMGGTSFDVGLVVDGEPVRKGMSVVNQYEYLVPSVDIQSIGSGGGSIVWVDERSKALHVGPLSAGSDPGPACYGIGGERPTVTDCTLLVGWLNPDNFLGGNLSLDVERAEEAVRKHVAEPLGMTTIEAARGALRVVNFQMADLIRQTTVGRGYDPRDFVVFAFGGAGPTHAPVYARELGAKHVVIPRGQLASLWSAYGAVSSDILLVLERSHAARAPFDPGALEEVFGRLEEEGRERLLSTGVEPDSIGFRRFVDLKYGMQVHLVEVPVASSIDAGNVEQILTDFDQRYESIFGAGTGFREAGVEMASVRVEAVAALDKPKVAVSAGAGSGDADPGSAPRRLVHWLEGDPVETPIVDGSALTPGAELKGPVVVELPVTTVPVHPGQTLRVDDSESLVLEFQADEQI